MAIVKIYPPTTVRIPLRLVSVGRWELLKIALFGVVGPSGTMFHGNRECYVLELDPARETEYFANAEEESE